jgi:hypothetical protein
MDSMTNPYYFKENIDTFNDCCREVSLLYPFDTVGWDCLILSTQVTPELRLLSNISWHFYLFNIFRRMHYTQKNNSYMEGQNSGLQLTDVKP